MKFKLLKLFTIVLYSNILFSQSFIEKQLPTPDNLSSIFIGPLIRSTIHYGAVPNNFNGDVILFNHGYIDLNQLFFTNNTFYEDAFNAGYQVVFVATTRGEGMWKNGELLAESIDMICDKYNVNDLNIIAHSNGGKASEVAMYTHNKSDKVKRVFALGTPYWGTYLADISQQWWFNWIWRHTGLNEGSATSTTYYCRDVVRPYFDNHPNNEPNKFYVIGGSGFASGHTILAPLMFTSGAILYTREGTNDGVASYNSTLRPNGNFLFNKNELRLDHIDVALGQYVWNYIEPILAGNSSRNTLTSNSTNTNIFEASSDYQIIHSENSYDQLTFDNDSSKGRLVVFHPSKKEVFDLKSDVYHISENEFCAEKRNGFNNHVSSYEISSLKRNISLSSNSKYVAYLHQPNGAKMIYQYDKLSKLVSINFTNTSTDVNSTKITAVISKDTDLLGNKASNSTFIKTFSFNENDESFVLDISSFDEGSYSIYVSANHKNFKRNIISGFTIGKLDISKLAIKTNTTSTNELTLRLQNTLVDHYLNFNLTGYNKFNTATNYRLNVFNLNGQKVMERTKKIRSGNFKINVEELHSGLYIVQVNLNGKLKSFKIIKN
ncbi:T9SS type A sorting domain-containing protein [Tenacibaculum xiamenense]|uniref:T9SS type A sorting domain-containing protein n=1 Tax=Tenacibaculum xiamenense TaxID=1261553 RepID=UPI003894F10F